MLGDIASGTSLASKFWDWKNNFFPLKLYAKHRINCKRYKFFDHLRSATITELCCKNVLRQLLRILKRNQPLRHMSQLTFNMTCLSTALQSGLNAAICGIWHCEPRKHLAKAIV